jgi:predicted amidohydrolase
MKLAAVQYRPPKGRPEAARIDLRLLIDEAAGQGAQLVVLPEMATTGYVWEGPNEIGPLTEPAHGPTASTLSAAARAHGLWIVCGYPERYVHPGRKGPNGRPLASLFNSALVINPDGELVTSYRKVLLYELDKSWATAGWRRVIVPSALGRMVPGICMDLNDDEFVSFLHGAEATLLPFCTNWLLEPGAELHRYWGARLDGWGGWMIAANTWGQDRGTRFAGRSAILGPGGVVVAEAPAEGDAVLVYDTARWSGRRAR